MNLNLTPNILSRIKQTSIFEKKILAQSLYSKFFILNKVSSTCFIIENNFKVFHLSEENCKQLIKLPPCCDAQETLHNFVGYSFLGTPAIFRDKYAKSLEFEHFLPRSHTYKSVVGVDHYVSSLERSLKRVPRFAQEAKKHLLNSNLSLASSNRNSYPALKHLFLDFCLKGGFYCRFNGLSGFLPTEQFRYGMSQWSKNFLPLTRPRGSNFLLIFWPSLFSNDTVNRLLTFRLPYLRIIPKINNRYKTVYTYSRVKSEQFFFGSADDSKLSSPSAGELVDARITRPTIMFTIFCKRLLTSKAQKSIPEIGEVPEALNVPVAVKVTKVGSVPAVARAPEAPKATRVGKVPAVAKAPEAPKATRVGKAPAVAKAPEAPKVTRVGKVPAVTKVPEALKAPKALKVTNMGKVLAVAKGPRVLKVPKVA